MSKGKGHAGKWVQRQRKGKEPANKGKESANKRARIYDSEIEVEDKGLESDDNGESVGEKPGVSQFSHFYV